MKIAAITAIQSGLDTLDIIRDRASIDLVIGLECKQGYNNVAGYVDVSGYCERVGYRYLGVSSYSLKDEQDQACLLGEDIDVLLVLGWQRLIPDWLIHHAKIAVLGGHGSAYGITAGRGRSPQNWALILGKPSFSISLFRIDAGVDSGPVLMERCFDYSMLDDIETSYYKTSWLMSEMIVELLNSNDPNKFVGIEQTRAPSYLPKRTADDGGIDWQQCAGQIYDFIRALTHPYPGAFTIAGTVNVNIWRAMPFDLPIDYTHFQPGEICQTFQNGNFIVRTGGGLLLVREWSTGGNGWHPCRGFVFSSVNAVQTMRKIIDRHQHAFPAKLLNFDIARLAE
jgi:UDP-4-amino-4-deoxy-L-arabinose formyltransferase/UDP-glucuronic acid dehydrogenase (UDP-4-keto-hexauronic acid decarboxylating)